MNSRADGEFISYVLMAVVLYALLVPTIYYMYFDEARLFGDRYDLNDGYLVDMLAPFSLVFSVPFTLAFVVLVAMPGRLWFRRAMIALLILTLVLAVAMIWYRLETSHSFGVDEIFYSVLFREILFAIVPALGALAGIVYGHWIGSQLFRRRELGVSRKERALFAFLWYLLLVPIDVITFTLHLMLLLAVR